MYILLSLMYILGSHKGAGFTLILIDEFNQGQIIYVLLYFPVFHLHVPLNLSLSPIVLNPSLLQPGQWRASDNKGRSRLLKVNVKPLP